MSHAGSGLPRRWGGVTATKVFSIGHSNHDPDHLVGLLVQHEIDVVVDVRSVPRSGYSPQFNQAPLKGLLAEHSIRYVFLGDQLGGRPDEDDLYDVDGHVRYDKVAETESFHAGLDRLIDGAGDFRVAMMCSEENPTDCHRRLLVGRVLEQDGVEVVHIRGDGRLEREADLPSTPEPLVEVNLFGEEKATWRSTRPVSRSGPPGSSSTP